METILNAKVYVGTYHKYNNSNLKGDWINLNEHYNLESFYDECKRLHNNEFAPEYMFQSHENIPNGFITECSIDKRIFDLIDKTHNFSEEKQRAFYIFLDNYDFKDSDYAQDIIDMFDDKYIGYFKSIYEFGYDLVDKYLGINNIEFIENYIDFKKLGEDLLNEESYCQFEGYYFNNY